MINPHKDSSPRAFQRLIIFTAFTAGLIISGNYIPGIGPEDGLFRNLMLTSLPMAGVLISSASVLGNLLLPLCSAAFGFIVRLYTELLAERYMAGAADIEGFLILLISVPVFFIVSVNGMETSRILFRAMNSCSTSSKSAYEREYIPMTVAVIAAVAAVCFITG